MKSMLVKRDNNNLSVVMSGSIRRKNLLYSFQPVGIEDTFTETGPYDELLEAYGISAPAIENKAVAMMKDANDTQGGTYE